MKKKCLYLHHEIHNDVYAESERKRIATLTDVLGPDEHTDILDRNPGILQDVEVLMATWGMPVVDERFLEAAPNLEAVFYAAGSVRGLVTEEFWDRSILLSSAWHANAVCVAEWAFAQIILCLKRTYESERYIRAHQFFEFPKDAVKGGFRSTVGLVSLGQIARRVAKFLELLDVRVIAYDPYVTPEDAREMGVELVSIEEVFEQSDVVSLHIPLMEQTAGMVNRDLLDRMRPSAALVNTARGGVCNFEDLVAFLQERSDVQAVIDVLDPYEPPEPDHPFFGMPNVMMTPHIAGATGGEKPRLGLYMTDELERWLTEKPLLYSLTREQAAKMA